MIDRLVERFDSDIWRTGFWFAIALMIAAPAVMNLPIIGIIFLLLSIAVALGMLSRPVEGIIVLLGFRTIADMMWATQISIFGFNVMELYSGLATVLGFLMLVPRQNMVIKHSYFLALIPLCLSLGIAAFNSINPRESIEYAIRYLSPAIFLFLVSAIFTERKHRRYLVFSLMGFSILPWLAALAQILFNTRQTFEMSGLMRYEGGYENVHNNAHCMALFATLGVFTYFFSADRRQKAIWVVYTAGCTFALYFTYVRNVWLGFSLFFITYLLVTRRLKWLALVSVAGGIWMTSSAVFSERFGELALLFEEQDSFVDTGSIGSGRIYMWKSILANYVHQVPFYQLFGRGFQAHLYLNPVKLDTHNDYLILLIQLGPMAVLSYIYFQWIGIREALFVRRAGDGEAREFASYTLALQAMVIITNLTSNSYIARVTIGWFYWALIGVLIAEGMDIRRKLSKLPGPARKQDGGNRLQENL